MAVVWQASPSTPPCDCSDGATSNEGLRSKKPNGLSQKATVSTGMMGQSSTRVMW
jgi:hypothetical protein